MSLNYDSEAGGEPVNLMAPSTPSVETSSSFQERILGAEKVARETAEINEPYGVFSGTVSSLRIFSTLSTAKETILCLGRNYISGTSDILRPGL
jgi:hypothetical protein